MNKQHGTTLVVAALGILAGCGERSQIPAVRLDAGNPTPDAMSVVDTGIDAGQTPGTGGDATVPGTGGTAPGTGGTAGTAPGTGGSAPGTGGSTPGTGGAPPTMDAGLPPPIPPAIDGQLVINEVMAANALTVFDEKGRAGDWVELFNPTTTDVPLAGYGLTTNLDMPGMVKFPAGPVLHAGEHLVVWLDGATGGGPLHMNLTVSKAGGALGFSRPDGTFIDRVTFAAQEVDFSAAREPDGSNLWVIEWHASPGAANPTGTGQPIGLEDVTQAAEAIPAAGDLSERILGYDVIPSFSLTIAAPQWTSLQNDPDTYVQATLTFDGRAYGPIGVHLKGMQSFEPIDQKPSLHLNIDKFVDGATFFGLKDITLNNMHSDSSMMHERMAYWVARQVGIPASRANHAMLTVNGQVYGLYANVETVKKRIVSRWFMNDTGSLFSATDVDFVAADIPAFELVTGPDDRTMLSGVATAMASGTPDQQMTAAAQYVNIDELRRFWAFCAIVGQFDSFPYSNPGDDYFMYADPMTQRLWFMPWGMDETFLSGDLDIVGRMWAPIAKSCMSSPDCFQAYVNQVWDVLGKVEGLDWLAEHDRVAAQIAPLIQMDTRRHYTDDEVAHGQSDMRFFVSERRMHLSTLIPPATSSP